MRLLVTSSPPIDKWSLFKWKWENIYHKHAKPKSRSDITRNKSVRIAWRGRLSPSANWYLKMSALLSTGREEGRMEETCCTSATSHCYRWSINCCWANIRNLTKSNLRKWNRIWKGSKAIEPINCAFGDAFGAQGSYVIGIVGSERKSFQGSPSSNLTESRHCCLDAV